MTEALPPCLMDIVYGYYSPWRQAFTLSLKAIDYPLYRHWIEAHDTAGNFSPWGGRLAAIRSTRRGYPRPDIHVKSWVNSMQCASKGIAASQV